MGIHSEKPVAPKPLGFTLIEMMMTIAVVAVLMSIAIPSFSSFIKNSRLTSAANDLLRAYQVARTEAIKRQKTVVVCASDNPTSATASCSEDAFSTGWIVFEDTNQNSDRDAGEALIINHGELEKGVITRDDGYALTAFNTAGTLSAIPDITLKIVICDDRGIDTIGTNSSARALIVTTTGRSRVSRTYADVSGTAISCS